MIELIAQNPIVAALIALVGLAIIFGALLGFAAEKFKVEGNPIVEQIDELLPQTQCGQCGFPGCRPYAESIANGDAINKCPPGGQATINAIASLLDVPAPELDEEHGQESPVTKRPASSRSARRPPTQNTPMTVAGTSSASYRVTMRRQSPQRLW